MLQHFHPVIFRPSHSLASIAICDIQQQRRSLDTKRGSFIGTSEYLSKFICFSSIGKTYDQNATEPTCNMAIDSTERRLKEHAVDT